MVCCFVATAVFFFAWSDHTPLAQAAKVKMCQGAGPGDIVLVELTRPCPPDYRATDIFDTETKESTPLSGNNSCNSLASCIAEVVYWFTVGLGTGVSWIGAWVLGLAVKLSLSSTAYALDFLSNGWEAVRDIANLFFILILIYIAFTIMFRAETADTMKRLAWVIVIALIINFSFFITRVVIDAGNLMAVQFYNAIPGPPISQSAEDLKLAEGDKPAPKTFGQSTKDLTFAIMNGIGMHKILSTESFKAFQEEQTGIGGFFTELITLIILYIVLGAMLFIIAAAFFTVGIKFLIRMVILWLLIIASPLALIAATLNETYGWYKRWLNGLIQHAFYPVVFLFVFYLITLLMKEIGNNGSIVENVFNSIHNLQTSGLEYLISLIAVISIYMGFVIILIYFGMKAADYVGVMGGQLAHSVTGRIVGTVGRGVAGTTGYTGRKVIGRAAYAISRSRGVAAGAQQGGLRGFLWRGFERGARWTASRSYDLRNAPGASLLKQGAELVIGASTPVGKPKGEGGYARERTERERLEAERRRERAAILRDAANREALERIASNTHGAGTPQRIADEERMRSLSKSELERILERARPEHLEALARVITESQLRSINDSDKVAENEKERIRMEYNERNPSAPLVRGQRIVIDELRQLNANLRTIGIVTVNTHSTPGGVINAANIAAMRDEIHNALATLRDNIRNAPQGTSTRNSQSDLIQLQNGLRILERLDEQRRNVPPNPAAGRPNAGEFLVT